MRAPHRGKHSVAIGLIMAPVAALLFVGLSYLARSPVDEAHASTPPADTGTTALVAPAPAVFEFVDRDFHCHYFGSSAGGMTPRLKGVNAEGVGMPWCDK